MFWVNNDSGDGPKLYAMTKDGAHRGVYTLGGAQAADWEDIAIGPGPTTGESYLYVGDIGDNPSTRPNVKLYRVAEPKVATTGPAATLTLAGVETFTAEPQGEAVCFGTNAAGYYTLSEGAQQPIYFFAKQP